MTDTVKFDAANHDACTAKMNAHCNDGRCWTVYAIFGRVTAKAHDNARRVPRAPASDSLDGLDAIYWHNGAWHKRRPATAAMKAKAWADADKAAGVSDGGSDDRKAMRRFWKARKRAHARDLARINRGSK